MTSTSYRDAGVDIAAGDALVEALKPLARATARPGVLGGLGGFAALFDLKAAGFVDPVLVATTDGVGTKLKLAIETGCHATVGIDLVAMCVNDLVVQGAEPLFFLDYFATGALAADQAKDVIAGIAAGCREAGCALVGGETAEMPGMYAAGDYDLAGFAVGAAERGALLPDRPRPGDAVIGLPSSGVHSNGFSLVRRIVAMSGLAWSDPAPFAAGRTLGDGLLTPTRIYVAPVLGLHRAGLLRAAAHVTGGGLPGNLVRVLPEGVTAVLDAGAWTPPPVFEWLARAGGVAPEEMLRVFNCGIGMALVVRDAAATIGWLAAAGQQAVPIGRLEAADGPPSVRIETPAGLAHVSKADDAPLHRKRAAVLISGRGSNLLALIAAASDPAYPAEIALVIANRQDAAGLAHAAAAAIATVVLDHREFVDRAAHEAAIDAALQRFDIEIVCLAGYMRVLTPFLVGRWSGRMLNIHPSLLPAFPGLDTHERALAAGVKLHGCTVHLVSEALDDGPIVAQAAVPVLPADTAETLAARVLAQEHAIYPLALGLLAGAGKIVSPDTAASLVNPLPGKIGRP